MTRPLTIEGLQEAQAANLRAVRAVRVDGVLGQEVRRVTVAAHRYAAAITHVHTGALRAAHRMAQEGPAHWRIAIEPTARNPRTGERVAEYGQAEHGRGGAHAFYERTAEEEGQRLAAEALTRIEGELR